MKEFNRALITGATSGIGKALAELLAQKGIPLILTGRNFSKLEEIRRALNKKVPVEILVADLGIKEDRESIVKFLRDTQVDLLINNAGFGYYGSVLSRETSDWLNMLEVDVAAVLELTVEGAKALTTRGQRGIIMNISSAAAFQIFPHLAVYAASKAFLNSFSQSLDYDLKPQGIRVLIACPGKVATAFRARASGRALSVRAEGLFMSVEYAAKSIWNQIQNEKRLHIFDWRYRLGTYLSYLIPNAWLVKITKAL